MIVKSVHLKNYRNYDNQTISFKPGLNVLVGENAVGKTNLIESIFVSSMYSSPKKANDKDLVSFNKDNAQIKLELQKKYRSHTILIKIPTSGKKSVAVDGIPLTKSSDLLGILSVVFFSPQEMKLIQESPQDRRKFLDISLSQQEKPYLKALSNYNKILTQKNALLKEEISVENLNDMLNIWDQQLAKEGEIIISRRMEFLKKLSKYASAQNTIISGGKDTLQLSYDANISLEGSIQDNLYNALLENREKDISLRFTTVGPHRDDINIILNGKDAKKFGSQGQQRSITLAMKLASLYIYKDEMGEFPVLLLDDVLSELDPNRQQVFLESLKDIQCILSCTKYTVNVDANIINIENGKVKN